MPASNVVPLTRRRDHKYPRPPQAAFKPTVDALALLKSEGLPSTILRSEHFSKISNSIPVKVSLIANFRKLGFIDGRGAPTLRLAEMLSGDSGRQRRAWVEALREAFPYLMTGETFSKLADLTTADLYTIIEREAEVRAGPLRKAVSFFTVAANHAGIAIPNVRTRKPVEKPARALVKTVAKAESHDGLPPLPDFSLIKDPIAQLKWMELYERRYLAQKKGGQ